MIDDITQKFMRILLTTELKAFVDVFEALDYRDGLNGTTIGAFDALYNFLHLAKHTKLVEFARLRMATVVFDEIIV